MASLSGEGADPRVTPDRFRYVQHAVIARMLRGMRTDLLMEAGCWFAGGTAIVLTHGEYRLSMDVDFLCSSRDGYRHLRQAVVRHGANALFADDVRALRDFRCDQYGLRSAVEAEGQHVRVEIVREGRLELEGAYNEALGCPLLSLDDQFAEKLMANSDRGKDPAACYRDALDLGVLVESHGGSIPEAATAKATAAYGSDVWRDALWTVRHLNDRPDELERAATVLRMEVGHARRAVAALGAACRDHGP